MKQRASFPHAPPGLDPPFSVGLLVVQGLADAGHERDIVWGEVFRQTEAVRAGNGKEAGWAGWGELGVGRGLLLSSALLMVVVLITREWVLGCFNRSSAKVDVNIKCEAPCMYHSAIWQGPALA